jgi:hypothetical protein
VRDAHCVYCDGKPCPVDPSQNPQAHSLGEAYPCSYCTLQVLDGFSHPHCVCDTQKPRLSAEDYKREEAQYIRFMDAKLGNDTQYWQLTNLNAADILRLSRDREAAEARVRADARRKATLEAVANLQASTGEPLVFMTNTTNTPTDGFIRGGV